MAFHFISFFSFSSLHNGRYTTFDAHSMIICVSIIASQHSIHFFFSSLAFCFWNNVNEKKKKKWKRKNVHTRLCIALPMLAAILGLFVYDVCYEFRWKSVCLARMEHTRTHILALEMYLLFFFFLSNFCTQGEGLFLFLFSENCLHTSYAFCSICCFMEGIIDAQTWHCCDRQFIPHLSFCSHTIVCNVFILFVYFEFFAHLHVGRRAEYHLDLILFHSKMNGVTRHTKVQWHRCIEFRSGWSIQNSRLAFADCLL